MRDVAAEADYAGLSGRLAKEGEVIVQKAQSAALNLELVARYVTKKNHVEVTGEIKDTLEKDRALIISYPCQHGGKNE